MPLLGPLLSPLSLSEVFKNFKGLFSPKRSDLFPNRELENLTRLLVGPIF